MTGFGSAAAEISGFNCRLEIKTLNNRFKEFVIRSPHLASQWEEPIKKLVTSRIHRGRIEIWIQMEAFEDNSFGLSLNNETAKKAYGFLVSLKEQFDLKDEIGIAHLLSLGVITNEKNSSGTLNNKDNESLVEGLEALATQALDQLIAMRETEGGILANDLLGRLDALSIWLEELKQLSIFAPTAATKRYQARLEELAESLIDPARLAQEAAILAEKMDITEELTRFGSHIISFRNLLCQSQEPVGRRLEFLLQEMGREANTMGTKSQSKPITDLVLNFKSELEKVREQVLNIE
ncbi:MAG: YicC family protein [Deltaproteobacteria bacterium]|jgi:uncharacterized protein (TIGR00255 family)|nr:YicC family protein [Deltaproteobacteria bacterium]